MSALTVSADFVVTVLALWLGTLVLARTPRTVPARVFAFLAVLIAAWGALRIVGQLTTDDAVRRHANSAEVAIAPFLIAAFQHVVVTITSRERWRTSQWIAVVAGYVVGLLAAILSLADREHPISITPPNRSLGAIPGSAVGWGWSAFRASLFGLTIWWAWQARRAANRTGVRGEQLTAVLAAAVCAAVGGMATIFLAALGAPEWPGVLVIAISLGLTAYAIFAQGLFLDSGAARRSFSYFLGTCGLTVAYVVLILGLERVARQVLKTEAPLVTALAIVLIVALFDPLRERAWLLLNPHTRGPGRSYRRLMRALGDELLTAQQPRAAIPPALAQLCRSLTIRAAEVRDVEGAIVAAHGLPRADDTAPLLFPLEMATHAVGTLAVGPKRSHLPFTRTEKEVLETAAAFFATSLHLDVRATREAAMLDTLTEERIALQARESALAAALTVIEPAAGGNELHVRALGPLRVERNGALIRQWGGAKAGTRQAEAMFAFLFDREERGVAKDEFLDVIWPDVPLDKADLAFHRTLGGLRRTLEPNLKRGSEATAITYHNDRYRLDPALITWSDVGQFRTLINAGAGAEETLEEARALYRGDYLDDCPFYGDSEYVEERRELLRGQYIDVLLALAGHYEARGDVPAAAAYFREALAASGHDCPRADAGLARLGVAPVPPV
jgi:hypothetical protein